MSVIYKCEMCDEETVVERVLPGAPLKCIHCGSEKLGDLNGTTLWMDVPLEDMTSSGRHDGNSTDPETDV